MSERHLVLVAASAFIGALSPRIVPLAIIVTCLIVAMSSRRALLVALAIGVCCAGLAERSWAGVETDRSGRVEGSATVLTDPRRLGSATSAVLRIEGARYLATGWGPTGARLARLAAGDQTTIVGTARVAVSSRERQAALHTRTRLSLTTVGAHATTSLLWQAANGIRNHLTSGSASLSPERQALFTGIVYGDDRGQDDLVASDFRLAGLTHLLAVSGQNVAYVLTMVRPLVERLRLPGRWVATVSILLLFATVTRFEPSVLRATAMAGLAVSARLVGREASSGRLLAAAVTLLLVIDPLLAHTVAFRLSVAASAGIVWLQPAVTPGRLRPEWLRDAVGVTLAAQLGVAPVLITTFGPVSLVSVPANVAAGPVAGAAMGWGVSGGLIAGWLPAPAAAALHEVTNVLLWALETIARGAAGVPLAPVGLAWIGVACLAAAMWWLRTVHRSLGVAAVALALVLGVALAPHPHSGRHDLGRTSEAWVTGDNVVVILNEAFSGRLLDDLRGLEIRTIDILATHPDNARAAHMVDGRLSVVSTVVVTGDAVHVPFAGGALVIEDEDGSLTTTRHR